MSIFQKWKKPEEGRLEVVVKNNAETIDANGWIKSLIQHHKIHRFGSPVVSPSVFKHLNIGQEELMDIMRETTYPLTITNNDIWVGILRHDTKLEQVRQALNGFNNHYFCAISPIEARSLDKEFVKYGKQVLKMVFE